MSSSSLVGIDPMTPAVIEPHSAFADQSAARRETNLLQLCWKSRWLILLLMGVGGVASWFVVQRVTPLYTSISRICVERNLPRILSSDGQVSESSNFLYTQAELIQSTSVLAAAVDAPGNADLETFRNIDNRVGYLKKHLHVVVGGQDEIINVVAELSNGKDAAQLVNSVVDAYISKYVEQRRTKTVDVLNVLRNDKERRDAELEERRKALEDFRQQHAALAVHVDKENVVTSRFAALADELNSTEISLLETKARYYRIKEMYDSPTQRPMLLEMASTQQKGARDVELESRVQQVEQSLISERAHWGEGHPRVRLLRDSLDELRARLEKQNKAVIDSFVESVQQDYELLDHKRNELRAAYDKQFKMATEVSSQALELTALEDALKRTEHDCDILEDRMKELNLTEEVGSMNVSIMDPAAPPTIPSYPVHSQFLAAGIFLGGLTGLGLAWLRDLLDHRIRTIEEMGEVLQLPVLGALPYFGDGRGAAQAGQLVATSPRSMAAETVRTLRTAIHFGLGGAQSKTIAVTSPSPGDGKSTVASNLAIAMAQSGQRVLLIDADLRKPTQHNIFEVSPERGLGSVLAERRPVEEAIIPGVSGSLDLLPCGPCPANPVELLNNGFFAELIDSLKNRYDKIIIDSPPVMPVADARVIAAMADATILVLRAEHSTRRLSIAARNELWRVRAPRLGLVVNRVPTGKHESYNYGYGSSGYDSYAAYGGELTDQRPSSKRRSSPARESTATVATGTDKS
jgi:succinoglycan biosynthesis transport protein ExoP